METHKLYFHFDDISSSSQSVYVKMLYALFPLQRQFLLLWYLKCTKSWCLISGCVKFLIFISKKLILFCIDFQHKLAFMFIHTIFETHGRSSSLLFANSLYSFDRFIFMSFCGLFGALVCVISAIRCRLDHFVWYHGLLELLSFGRGVLNALVQEGCSP